MGWCSMKGDAEIGAGLTNCNTGRSLSLGLKEARIGGGCAAAGLRAGVAATTGGAAIALLAGRAAGAWDAAGPAATSGSPQRRHGIAVPANSAGIRYRRAQRLQSMATVCFDGAIGTTAGCS
jgi:hypothetical protein